MDDAKVKALVPWYGSKRTLAPIIVEALGPHRAYYEVFAGSMAVLFAKERCALEVVNDLHGELINLARVVRDSVLGPALYRRLRRVLSHEAIYHESRGEVQCDDPVEQAERFFIRSWMGRNGVVGAKRGNEGFAKRWTPGGGSPATRWKSSVDSIPAMRRRLRDVAIYQMDAMEMIDKIEDEDGVAIYADPPYLRKKSKYEHDFLFDDHSRLATCLGRFRKARVVVSYYEHPRLADLYPEHRWRRIRPKVNKNLGQAHRGKAPDAAPEVLLVNDIHDPLADIRKGQ